MRILLSGGSYKFHLAPLAAELSAANSLVQYLTAGWPKGWQLKLASAFPESPGWRRFLDRQEEIPDHLVSSCPLSELIFKVADLLFSRTSPFSQQITHRLGFAIYGLGALRQLYVSKPSIYHYRNCYGGLSVTAARRLGIPTLCDHSIAHPIFLHTMESHAGKWPNPSQLKEIQGHLTPLEASMLRDLNLADYILVNSDFVKETCVRAGWDPKDIYVVYLGIDNGFRDALREAERVNINQLPSSAILFAGGWQRRKGVETLARALAEIKTPWSLSIAGGMESAACQIDIVKRLMAKTNVNMLGILPRKQLANLMRQHRIFVFPSYCEGSARVIFEALAAGCFVITTPNSGSIVKDGIHGKLVEPGDHVALEAAITWALNNPNTISQIGDRNATLVHDQYLQSNYALRVKGIYAEVLNRGQRSLRQGESDR